MTMTTATATASATAVSDIVSYIILFIQPVVMCALLVVVAEEEGFGEEHYRDANNGNDCEENLY